MTDNANTLVEVNKNRPTVTMSRRQLVAGLASGSVVALSGASLSGCVMNEALGRKQLLLVSESDLEQLSAASWQQALQQNRQTSDAGLRRQVNAIGDRIVMGANSLYPSKGLTNRNWEYAVFDDPTVNAWVMPGGKVGFHTGLLDITQNDDQIATVMGHEVAHVVGRHAAERYSQQIAANSALQVANVALADNENRDLIAGILGAGVTFGYILPYSRKHEYEADRLGADFMVSADYRAKEAVRFWDGMTQRNNQRQAAFMSTHPSDQSRISTMQNYIQSQGYA